MTETKMETGKEEPQAEVRTDGRLSVPVNMRDDFDASKIAGKTVLITGGSTGFGAAFARE
jgi:FlaA1/EpsC-like NDP-sugar epimerase